MMQWASQLIPAGSVVVGGLVTGSLTLWGQALVNKGTHKREREARHDAFKVRQREIEREALLALQDALSELFSVNMILPTAPGSRPADVRTRMRELQMKFVALSTRVPADVSVAARKYSGAVFSRVELSEQVSHEEMADYFVEAQALAGQALRRPL
jgi:hypothetical protein